MPRRNRYDEAFDNLWADEATKPREYSEFEQEEAAVKIQAAIRGRQTRREIIGQKDQNLKKKRRSKKKRKAKKKNDNSNEEFIKTNTLSELERKVAELEQKHSVQEKKSGFFSGARKRMFGDSSPKQGNEPVNHRQLRQEREEAARKIQAIQRGKMGRRKAANRKQKFQQREDEKRQIKEQLRREREERMIRNRERNAMYEERRKARQQKLLMENQLTEENKKKQRSMAEKRRKNNKKKGNAEKMLAQQRLLQYDAIVSLFNKFDSDGGGTISMYELRDMCQHMSQSKQIALPFEDELEATISLMTRNRNFTNISQSQFEDWVGQIISMSGQQIASIKNTSPFHERYTNLILVCRDWLNTVVQNQWQQQQINVQDDGLSPRQRRKQELLRRQQEEEMKRTVKVKVGSDAVAERHRQIIERQQAKEMARKQHAELKQKQRNEAEHYRAQQLKEQYELKQEMAKQNSRRIDAIHRYRQEEYSKKLEAIDKAKQELMERKGYVVQGKGAESIASNATSSQLLGMSTSTRHYDMSLPKKKHRVITEYYPGQQEVHSINQVEADISHWLFMQNEQNVENDNTSERSIFLSQSSIKDLSDSGDWEDWNDDTESSSLMQQGSSLMSKQPENYGYALQSVSLESNASNIKTIFDYYSNGKRAAENIRGH